MLRRGLLTVFSSAKRSHSAISIDPNEITRFGQLSAQWFDEQGPFKALHSLNKLRVPWIVKNLPKGDTTSLSIVDIGCGGGLLSVPLARVGLQVTGIDATPEAIAAAKEWLETPSSQRSLANYSLQYEQSTVEDFAARNRAKFDVVVASEIVEHVADAKNFVAACAELVRPGGILFFTTINKTLMSRIGAIFLAENILRIVPEGVHDWDKFVSPEELTSILHDNGCAVRLINGFTYNPICNNWHWAGSTQINYGLIARKN